MLVANRTPLGDSPLPLYLLSPSASLAEDRLEGLQITFTVVIVLDREDDRHPFPSMRKRSMKTPRDFQKALAERTTAPN